MSIYKNAFLRALLLDDGNVAGSGGALGDWTQSHFSGDFYAPGDARRPFALGAMQRRAGASKKKRKKKKRKSKKKKTTIKEKIRNVVPSHWQQPGGDEGQPLEVSTETIELINLVKRAETTAQFNTAQYTITEIWNGWGESLQDKITRELLVIEDRGQSGAAQATVVLRLIKQAEQQSNEDDEARDVDPNGGHRGLSI